MSATCLTLGLVGLVSTYAGTQFWTSCFNGAFAFSVGAGLAVAYLFSRKYPPEIF
jgi:hypothetical protein